MDLCCAFVGLLKISGENQGGFEGPPGVLLAGSVDLSGPCLGLWGALGGRWRSKNIEKNLCKLYIETPETCKNIHELHTWASGILHESLNAYKNM